MQIMYKINVLSELKKAGYNTSRLRKEHLLAEGTIQSLRHNKLVSLNIIAKLCELLSLEPGDIIGVKKNE